MTDDIVARLREGADYEHDTCVMEEAADRIEQLKNQISHIIKHNNPQIENANSYFKLLEEEIARCNKIIDGYEEEHKQTNSAYTERNRLVALIASLYPSGIKKTDIPGWDEEWHGCVYIDLPTGQASWHYHDSEAWMFRHLPRYEGEWDGHTTEEKYDRVAALELRHIMERIND